MKKAFLSILFICLITSPVFTQIPVKQNPDSIPLNNFDILSSVVMDGETIPHATIKEVVVFPRKQFRSKRHFRQYSRLMRNVQTVYPYALLAREKMLEMEVQISQLKTEKERRNYINQVEKQLFAELEDELKGLTITQGRILIKLVDRETGDTSYDLIKELKGSFSAFFWQSIARLFGSNLKTEYDPYGEDALIEEIILMIKMGYI